MSRERINFAYLNAGHFLDHLFVLIFATVAALRLSSEWGMTYAELIPYATPGFVAFGVCAIPAGWLADKWSREGMMTIFFIGAGICAILTSMANTPLQIGVGLACVGVFAAIYHPVGIAMVVHGREKTGVPLAINGIYGNMGVAAAALITGFLIDATGWRTAYILPGALSIIIGVTYGLFVHAGRHERAAEAASGSSRAAAPMTIDKATLVRVFAIIFFSTAIGGVIFQSTTFALPKIFDERLSDFADTATSVGLYAFLVFALAAFAQLAVGYLVDRYSVRLVFGIVAGLQAVLFAMMVNLSGYWALVVSLGFMLVVFGQIPINDVLLGRITRSEWRARAYAMRSIITFTVAASVVPMIAGIHAGWGFSVLFIVLAVSASLIFAAVLMLPSTAAVTGQARAAK